MPRLHKRYWQVENNKCWARVYCLEAEIKQMREGILALANEIDRPSDGLHNPGLIAASLTSLAKEKWRLAYQRDTLEAEIERLRLERDVLALNRRSKDSQVIVLYDEASEVIRVIWPEIQSVMEEPVRLPAYATPEAEEE